MPEPEGDGDMSDSAMEYDGEYRQCVAWMRTDANCFECRCDTCVAEENKYLKEQLLFLNDYTDPSAS